MFERYLRKYGKDLVREIITVGLSLLNLRLQSGTNAIAVKLE